jgi:hypothetical protein
VEPESGAERGGDERAQVRTDCHGNAGTYARLKDGPRRGFGNVEERWDSGRVGWKDGKGKRQVVG